MGEVLQLFVAVSIPYGIVPFAGVQVFAFSSQTRCPIFIALPALPQGGHTGWVDLWAVTDPPALTYITLPWRVRRDFGPEVQRFSRVGARRPFGALQPSVRRLHIDDE